MRSYMAQSTKWYDVKAMLFIIAFVMMPMLCSFSTLTYEIGCWRECSMLNGLTNSPLSQYFIMVLAPETLTKLETFFAVMPFRITILVIVSLMVFVNLFLSKFLSAFCFSPSHNFRFIAIFTPATMSIFVARMFVKLRVCFNFLAFRALFCLNSVRHFRFLFKRICLGPSARTTLALGPFILTTTIFMSILLSEMRNEYDRTNTKHSKGSSEDCGPDEENQAERKISCQQKEEVRYSKPEQLRCRRKSIFM